MNETPTKHSFEITWNALKFCVHNFNADRCMFIFIFPTVICYVFSSSSSSSCFHHLKNIISPCVNTVGGKEWEIWKLIPRLSMARSVSHSAGHCLLIPHSQRAEKKWNSRKNRRERVWRAKKKFNSQLELSLLLLPPPPLDAHFSPEGKTVFYYFRFSILHNCTFVTFFLFPTTVERDGEKSWCRWWCWWIVKNHVAQKFLFHRSSWASNQHQSSRTFLLHLETCSDGQIGWTAG